MRGIKGTIILVASIAALAGCGTAASTSSPSTSSPSTSSPTTSSPATSTMPALKIITVSCGRYTPAQRARFGTNAVAGYVATITNESGAAMSQPQVDVNFVLGTTVDTSNVTGSTAPLAPGQSEQVAVDNVSAGGTNGNPADTCQVTGYGYYGPDGNWVKTGS